MPYDIKKVGGKYQVRSPHGIKSRGTTKEKAERQTRLLRAVKHGWKPTGAPASESVSELAQAIVDNILHGEESKENS